MASIAVHLNRPPHSARLTAWGRADDGWWACITWRQRVHGQRGVEDIGFAAWVPAAAVSRPSWSPAIEVARLTLPADRSSWPAPPGWPSWYAGVWADGPVNAPGGLEVVTGPAWRVRPRLNGGH